MALLVVAVASAMAMAVAARAESLVDPTRPPGQTAAGTGAVRAPGGPVLQSILVSPQRRFAVIGGRRVSVGDKWNGAVVVDILPYEVRLDRGGREIVLRLQPKLAKEPGKSE